jgi:hypothetical protein
VAELRGINVHAKIVGRCWANLGVCNYQGTGGTGG